MTHGENRIFFHRNGKQAISPNSSTPFVHFTVAAAAANRKDHLSQALAFSSIHWLKVTTAASPNKAANRSVYAHPAKYRVVTPASSAADATHPAPMDRVPGENLCARRRVKPSVPMKKSMPNPHPVTAAVCARLRVKAKVKSISASWGCPQ